MPTSPPTIAIIGGGIGGLALAIGLHNLSIPFTLYEAASQFSAIGAGVGLGPNAVNAMELISPELADQYMSISTGNASVDAIGIYDLLSAEPGLGESWGWTSQPVGEKGVKFKCTNAHRGELLEVMVGLIPKERVVFRKRAVRAVQEGEKVKVQFADGDEVAVDCLIGCDGCKSRMREMVISDEEHGAKPEWGGTVVYRGILDVETAVGLVGKYRAENTTMYIGKGNNVLSFPIEKGNKVNVVAFKRLGGIWEGEEWTQEVSRETMESEFQDCDESLRGLLSHMKPIRWALFDHCNTPTYFKSHICLLGDSAHASTPHQAAGAGQAIEDALILSRLLSKVKQASEIEQCFRVYDSMRRPRAQKVVVTSREAGLIYHGKDETLGNNLAAMVNNLRERFPWIWDYDLEGAVREAEVQFELAVGR